MHKIAAELRHRELTQEIYNIGDEVAEYLEHLIEAIEDWDEELCMDCLAELGDIVEDARVDSGRCVGELMGLRQALVSGVRSGTISAASSGVNDVEEPEQLTPRLLDERFPISKPIVVHELAESPALSHPGRGGLPPRGSRVRARANRRRGPQPRHGLAAALVQAYRRVRPHCGPSVEAHGAGYPPGLCPHDARA